MSQSNSQAETIDAVLLRACAARDAVRAVVAAASPLLSAGEGDSGQHFEGEGREMNDLEGELTPIEAAKLNVTVAYSIASLYYMLLRAKGASQQTHPIRSEIERVRVHVERIRKAEAGLSRPSSDGSSSEPSSGGRASHGTSEKTFVDTTVIKRTIGHELGIKAISKDLHTSHDMHSSKSSKKRKV